MITGLALALLVSAAGIACLFGAWQGWVSRRWLALPLGWGLLVISGWLWVMVSGVEYGLVLVFAVPSVLAWVVVVGNRQLRSNRRGVSEGPPRVSTESVSWGRHALYLFLVVPVAAVSATLVSVALSLALPWLSIDAMVAVLVLLPVLWGAAAYWVLADSQLVRPVAMMTVGSLVSAAIIALPLVTGS